MDLARKTIQCIAQRSNASGLLQGRSLFNSALPLGLAAAEASASCIIFSTFAALFMRVASAANAWVATSVVETRRIVRSTSLGL